MDMKNALLLSLALIAVGPVAVEGQGIQGTIPYPEQIDRELAGLLLQSENCGSGMCSYHLPGLVDEIGVEFVIFSSGEVLVVEKSRLFIGHLMFCADRGVLSIGLERAVVWISLAGKNGPSFVVLGPRSCR